MYTEQVESAMRTQNNQLSQQLREQSMDLDAARNSRRQLQLRLQEIEEHMGFVSLDNEKLKNRNPYVFVLIDGDGLIFRQEFIKQGAEGGRRAAVELHEAVATDPLIHADGADIIVKVVASLGGLNRALRRDGLVTAENGLEDFVGGFNQAALFDFVDMGASKERTISKVKETALFHIKNASCRQIIMGVAHDPTYGAILDEIIKGNASSRDRIKVLEGHSTVRAVASVGTEIIRFHDVFRSDKLTDRRTVSSHSVHSVQSGSSISTSTSALPNISYATVTRKASPPPQITLPIPLVPKNTNTSLRVVKQPPKSSWNPGPRGLDTPIPLSQIALETIKKRKDNNKLCNNHFLRGPCAKGDECCFVHDYNPNKDEKNAIAFLARLNPCTNGQDCEVDNCIYGHHCPSVVNGICTHPFCKFRPEEHPPGTKLRSVKA